ncbi:hypothetical protein NUH88_02600 [Nisaea acidiphila]|uniref:Uncharacterized protein n=1 Tax=Nisaea acidiphila TaxID=1862145 RepID=A0A9J7AU05_9PROT|nr:hypothetical protein [Nisaea acidiphila]UUX50590.1 hypothetical protein NUH88_02600 [Nisaea acidiphila]
MNFRQFLRGRLFTALLLGAIAAFLTALFASDAFFDWAFARHHSTLSWAARPLLVLPYIYFARRRSLNGILASVLALLTSMLWFPAPAETDPRVAEFLAMEQERLQAGLDLKNLLGLAAVLGYGWALAAAFWKRSLLIGGAVVVAGAAGKMVWSLVEGGESGTALLPFAVGGAVVTVVTLALLAMRRKPLGR